MKYGLVRRLFIVVGLCLSLAVLDFCGCWAAESGQVGGAIQGRFVWADNTPVTNCRVKLVDKIDVFSAPTPQGYSVQQIAISIDAQVRETDVDTEGRFRFTGLPAGKYCFFFRAPGIFEGDDWVYQYTIVRGPLGTWRLAGYMEKPDEYEVNDGVTTDIPDIVLTHPIEPNNPIPVSDKPGVLEFQWPEHNSGNVSRITITHLAYRDLFDRVTLAHPAYGSHEVPGNSYRIPIENPLYPGSHHFRVEILTPTFRVFAESEWMDFTVPGDVLFLRVNEDENDPSGRTIIWSGSPEIKSVRIVAQDGTLDLISSEHSIELPSVTGGRELCFHALDADGNELIPGWRKFLWQQETELD